MSAPEHAHDHASLSGILAEAYGIFTDPAHILAEVGFAGVEALIGAVVGAFLVRRHDARHHAQHEHTPTPILEDVQMPAGLTGEAVTEYVQESVELL